MPTDTKKIAKNATFLYIRMFFILICNLIVVKVVLNALGAEDYGINNVVGGIVMMFAFLTSTMTAASQRFFSFELGKKDLEGLSHFFLTTLWGYLGIAAIVLIVAETIGLWFVINKLTILPSRLDAAIWVYQSSIISFIFGILAIPFNSIIIAREKMNVYAYIGILEVILRLCVAYTLFIYFGDRLKFYAILQAFALSIPSFIYIIWGCSRFDECKIKKYWNKKIFKEIFSYSCWNLFGAMASILRSQGINILLNIFFGPIVNASRAIAYQVSSAINQFVLNFFKAVQPQIVKSYAANERKQMLELVYTSSKYCFYLLFILALPVFIGTPFILSVWLGNIPENTVIFTRLVIILALIESTIYPLQTALMSTGNIKWYQIITGGLLLLNLPISWLFLYVGFEATSTFYVAIIIALISQISRVIFMKKMLLMPILEYINKSLLPIACVFGFSIILLKFFQISFQISSFFDLIWMAIISTASILLGCICFGTSKKEKKFFKDFIFLRIGKWTKKK